jgi:uncharacterized protein (TIGR03067 family)
MTVKGNKYELVLHGRKSEGTQKIDPAKKPRHIDATTTKGEGEGQTYLGIYEIDGDTYKECYASPGRERPTTFDAKEGSGHILFVWKREKAEK